jgi:hypothetical protein
MVGFPTECVLKFFLACDENSGIARAARGDFPRNLAASDAFRFFDDFENGEATAVANIECFARDTVEGFERAKMGIRDVEHVDVVADAGAVWRGVIGAENFHVGNGARCGVENAGDEVGFDAMVLATFGGGAGSVEVTKDGIIEARVAAIVREDFFKAKFGFAVGINGAFGVVFGNRNGVRLPIGGGGGREDEFCDAVARYGVEEIDAGGDIGGIEGAWFSDGFSNERFPGEMHDGVNFLRGEDFFDLGTDAEVGSKEGSRAWDGGEVAFLKIIERDDLMSAGEKNFGANASDIAGSASNENSQG